MDWVGKTTFQLLQVAPTQWKWDLPAAATAAVSVVLLLILSVLALCKATARLAHRVVDIPVMVAAMAAMVVNMAVVVQVGIPATAATKTLVAQVAVAQVAAVIHQHTEELQVAEPVLLVKAQADHTPMPVVAEADQEVSPE